MLFEHGFYLTKPIWALTSLHDVTWESVVALTDHFAYAFIWENNVCVYDVVAYYYVLKFDADAILIREILCKKRDILMFKRLFQRHLG